MRSVFKVESRVGGPGCFVKGGRWWLWGVLVLLFMGFGVVLADEFSDDDGRYYEPAIDALAERGVLDGTECDTDRICPDDDFERWTMAVWLVRVLDNQDPEPTNVSQFVDVDPNQWWAPFVDRLAELGVTKGCAVNPARFCPDQPATRAEMATFLTRAFKLEAGSPAGFVDIAGTSHAANINALAAANITQGCALSPPQYCPESPVSRGQMATFLARALKLIPLPPTVSKPTYQIGYVRDSTLDFKLRRRIGGTSFGYGAPHGTPNTFLVGADEPNVTQLTQDGSDPVWSPDGTKIAYSGPDQSGRNSQLLVIDADGSNRYVLATGTDPTWSSDGTKIAYDSPAGIIVVAADGTNPQLLARGFEPALSPDGSKVAYRDLTESRRVEVFVVNADGGVPQQLTTGGSQGRYWPGLVWSPDGTKIAYVTDPSGTSGSTDSIEIVVVDIESNSQYSVAEGRDPVWSPDGTKIAYTESNSYIGIVGADGSNQQVLRNGTDPSWSPDGTKIAFLFWELIIDWEGDEGPAVREETQYIVVMDMDGSNRQLIAERAVPTQTEYGTRRPREYAPAWSPDGTLIAFSYNNEGISVVDTSGIFQSLSRYWNDFDPVWSPDGAQVAFSSDRDGDSEIFVMNADGTDLQQLTNNDQHDVNPIWSSDGTTITYVVFDLRYGDVQIMAMDGTGDNQQLLGTGQDPVWSPDGTRIAYTSREADQTAVNILDLNGNQQQQRAHSPNSGSVNLVWSSDGTHIAYTIWEDSVQTIVFGETSGGTQQQVIKPSLQSVFSIALSADGTQIAYTGREGTTSALVVADTSSGTEQQLITSNRFIDDPVWSPNGAHILYVDRGDIFIMDPGSGEATQLTDRLNANDPLWSPDGTKIVYTDRSGVDSPWNRVFIMDADGTNVRLLTPAGGKGPVLSPDSKNVVYVHGGAIHVADLDDNHLRALTTNTYWDTYPTWSPDGSKLVNVRHGVGLFLMDPDGTNVEQLTSGGRDRNPSWSSDGTRIAYTNTEGIFVVEAQGGKPQRIVQALGSSNPVWSPDNTRIAYTAFERVDGAFKAHTYIIDAEGKNRLALTQERTLEIVWAPDNSQLAFTTRGDSFQENIVVIDSDGTNRRILVEGTEPAWSPDGTTIAYTIWGERGREIFLIDVDGGPQKRLVAGTNPVWSPDSTRIAYTTGFSDSGIFVIDADGTNARELTDRGQHPVWIPTR